MAKVSAMETAILDIFWLAGRCHTDYRQRRKLDRSFFYIYATCYPVDVVVPPVSICPVVRDLWLDCPECGGCGKDWPDGGSGMFVSRIDAIACDICGGHGQVGFDIDTYFAHPANSPETTVLELGRR